MAVALDWNAFAKQLTRIDCTSHSPDFANQQSLLVFIHKDVFADAESYLRAMFKSSNQVNLLAQQRVSRARVLLTPFVLRRRKAAVLSLPPKIETSEHCDMTPVQAKLYRETMGRSRKILAELNDEALEAAAADDEVQTTKGKAGAKKGAKKDEKKNAAGHSTHIIMDLRKAASHPLLFRRLYDDKKIRQIAKECLNTPTWCDSVFEYVVEDLEIMSDAELHHFCVESDYTVSPACHPMILAELKANPEIRFG